MGLIYLPMADLYISLSLLIAIGIMGGVVSSMLGIGGGIIITPSLMSIGVPASVAISTQLGNAVGTSFCGFLAYQQERDVDISLALYLLVGGITGALLEKLTIYQIQTRSGNLALLKIIVFSMLVISGIVAFIQSQRIERQPYEKGAMMRRWMIYFPWHKIFLRSRVEMSILVPLFVGFFTGMVTTSLGGGNSLLIAPILTYLLGRQSPVVAGTSLLAGFGINIVATFISVLQRAPIDFILLAILITSSILGSFIGTHLAYRFDRKILGRIGAVAIIGVSFKMYLELKEASWQIVKRGEDFFDKFSLIVKKISINPHETWVLPIVRYAHDNPKEYTIAILVGVTIFAIFAQILLSRFKKKV